MPNRYFKLCSKESYAVLSDPDEIAELLSDWSWYEIPAWDYERRNRRFAHKVHITPAPDIKAGIDTACPECHCDKTQYVGLDDITGEIRRQCDECGNVFYPSDSISNNDFRNEGEGYFDIA